VVVDLAGAVNIRLGIAIVGSADFVDELVLAEISDSRHDHRRRYHRS
jgi:hypothetical protein